MLKKLSLFAAVSWTLIVFSLCLVKSSEIPVVNIVNLDKLVHAFFHFVFVILWFTWFSYQYKQVAYYKLVAIVFILSVFYGVAIEVAQLVFTETRFADVFDVLANLTGAVLGVAALTLVVKVFRINKI